MATSVPFIVIFETTLVSSRKDDRKGCEESCEKLCVEHQNRPRWSSVTKEGKCSKCQPPTLKGLHESNLDLTEIRKRIGIAIGVSHPEIKET